MNHTCQIHTHTNHKNYHKKRSTYHEGEESPHVQEVVTQCEEVYTPPQGKKTQEGAEDVQAKASGEEKALHTQTIQLVSVQTILRQGSNQYNYTIP